MAAPDKLVPIFGVTGKTEASYGAGGSLSTSTDGLQADEPPKLALKYLNNGQRPAPPGNLGYQRKVIPSGRGATLPFKHAAKGPTSAYSASNFSTVHNPMRWCGFDATGSFVGGSEKFTYNPTPGPGGYASGVGNLYVRQELWPFTGILGDFTWGFKGVEVPIFDFSFSGLLGAWSDTSAPAITYPFPAVDPPKASSVTMTLFGVSVTKVREATLKLGRTIQSRLDVTVAGGHLGWVPVRRTPTLEVLIETPLIAASDLMTAWETAVSNTWSLNWGAVQYNRFKWSGSAAQIMQEPVFDDDGAVALTRLVLQLGATSPSANDDLQLITD